MIINGRKVLILRCRFCGRLLEYDFNIFKVMSGDKIEYRCKCGETNASIKKRDDGKIAMEIGCINCGDKHYHRLGLRDILKESNILYCSQGFKLAFLGDIHVGNRMLFEERINITEVVMEKAKKNYFNNSDIMLKSLDKLFALNRENNIGCNCGKSKIDIDFFPDRIELKCCSCKSVNIIFAETQEDLSVLLKRDRIELKEHSISCIDSINEENRNARRGKCLE
mgnify:CR=1 FL=1